MPEAPATVLETVDLQGCGLRVTFFWRHDRYAHTVALLDGERATVILASHEGTDQDPWPPAPPLQQLSTESRDGGKQVGLLVGMAAANHWSLSVETDSGLGEPAASANPPTVPGYDPRMRVPGPALVFDVACRLSQLPRWLGSQYEVDGQVQQLATASAALFQTAGQQWQLHVEPAGQEPPAGIERIGTRLAVTRTLDHPALPITVRWKYRIARSILTAPIQLAWMERKVRG